MGTRQDLSYVVLSDEGRVLGGKNYDTIAGPASVAKVMTAFVASDVLDRFDKSLSQKITIPSTLSYRGAANLRHLSPGDTISAGRALMLAGTISDAKSTRGLAVYAGRLLLAHEKGISDLSGISEREAEARFVKEMNNKAQTLGADQTVFYNSTGMPVVSGQLGNRTTAKEMGLVFQAFLNAHPKYSRLALGRGSRGHSLRGLRGEDLAKTGTTRFAGKTLAIDTTSNDGERISVVIFGAKNSRHRQQVLNEARLVADAATITPMDKKLRVFAKGLLQDQTFLHSIYGRSLSAEEFSQVRGILLDNQTQYTRSPYSPRKKTLASITSSSASGASSSSKQRRNVAGPFKRYSRRFLNGLSQDGRGLAYFKEHEGILREAAEQYGVDPYRLAATAGVETNFGQNIGRVRDLPSTYLSLMLDAKTKQTKNSFQYYKERKSDLAQALGMVVSGTIDRRHPASWAGALGVQQFQPSNLKPYGVDHDGGGINPRSHADAIFSIAKYYSERGRWKRGLSAGVEVVLPRGFDHKGLTVANSKKRTLEGKAKTVAEWEALGVTLHDSRSVAINPGLNSTTRAHLYAPDGKSGPHFLVTDNGQSGRRYNNDTKYMLKVLAVENLIRWQNEGGIAPVLPGWNIAFTRPNGSEQKGSDFQLQKDTAQLAATSSGTEAAKSQSVSHQETRSSSVSTNDFTRDRITEERNLVANFVEAARRKTKNLKGAFSEFAGRLKRATSPYVVRSGDALSHIAKRAKVSVAQLVTWNDSITNPNKIRAGEKINLRPNNMFSLVVKAGDTVSEIALKAGTTSEVIQAWNNLRNPDHVREGARLLVPVRRQEVLGLV